MLKKQPEDRLSVLSDTTDPSVLNVYRQDQPFLLLVWCREPLSEHT